MTRRVAPAAVLVALLVTSCASPFAPRIPAPGEGAAPSVSVPPEAAAQPTPSPDPPDPDFPKPSKEFAAHLTDPLYSDQGGEFAPFGTDEGWDTLYGWRERRADLTGCTTLRWMFTQDDQAGALEDPSRNGPDMDAFIIGAGFTLLLYTGHIDTEGTQLLLDALHRTYSYYAEYRPREPAVMIRDLESFPATDCSRP